MSKPLRIGQIFELSTDPNRYFVVTSRERFNLDDPDDSHFAAVATTLNSGWIDLVNLDPKENPPHLYQVHLGFENGGDYYIKFPTGTNIHGVNETKNVGFLNALRSPAIFPNDDYEYWLLSEYPSVNMVNNTPYAITPKIYASGYKYLFRPVGPREAAAVKARPTASIMLQRGGLAGMGGG